MPSIHGEDAVLRILDRQHLAQSMAGLTLAKLGFGPSTQDALRALCRKPHGMLLVTGPTGSGKTTTLYAAILETHLARDKIITIEDPVEYQLPGVLQIPVNERKGLTFARGLRSILRHDPDKILVGEIRDPETAQIAVQSALTGHLVFTTSTRTRSSTSSHGSSSSGSIRTRSPRPSMGSSRSVCCGRRASIAREADPSRTAATARRAAEPDTSGGLRSVSCCRCRPN
jgi:DNA polymerase III delta prime subunit